MKVLDYTGLSYLWEKIKNKFSTVQIEVDEIQPGTNEHVIPILSSRDKVKQLVDALMNKQKVQIVYSGSENNISIHDKSFPNATASYVWNISSNMLIDAGEEGVGGYVDVYTSFSAQSKPWHMVILTMYANNSDEFLYMPSGDFTLQERLVAGDNISIKTGADGYPVISADTVVVQLSSINDMTINDVIKLARAQKEKKPTVLNIDYDEHNNFSYNCTILNSEIQGDIGETLDVARIVVLLIEAHPSYEPVKVYIHEWTYFSFSPDELIHQSERIYPISIPNIDQLMANRSYIEKEITIGGETFNVWARENGGGGG